MSDSHTAHADHGGDMAHDAEHRHGYSKYVVVGVILTIITIVEIAIPSVPAIADAFTRPGVVASLLILSFAKGAGVVAYYMHLRDDNRLFTALFMFPFSIASMIVLILFLFFSLTGG
ncbi:MAG: cytochrome C oxidase subunit IV family protein [Chloroflexi bacterium]|nr:cytochrome C oxidase subunit IV family protein [Chloroflexota bacterium]